MPKEANAVTMEKSSEKISAKAGNYLAQKQLDEKTTPGEDERRARERARVAAFHVGR
jgi:hypothetical protein